MVVGLHTFIVHGPTQHYLWEHVWIPDRQPEESEPPTPKFSTSLPAETGGLESPTRATPSPPVPSKERDSVYFRGLGCKEIPCNAMPQTSKSCSNVCSKDEKVLLFTKLWGTRDVIKT